MWGFELKAALVDLAKELRTDVRSARVVPALSAGATAGLGLLVAQVAFATYIFSGPLASYSSQGVGLVLFGNFAACLVVALFGGFKGAIAGLSPALVVGMAVIASTMRASGDALFVSVFVALMLSAVLIGLCCLLMGRFQLANLMRFIPYPVSAGFVAGIGGAVCLAAMSLMGTELAPASIPTLFESHNFWRWSPGVVFGVALYFGMKRWRKPFVLPIGVVAAVAGYHLALTKLGVSADEARAMGLLLTSTATDNLWPSLTPGDLSRVEWAAVARQMPNMLALVVVAFIAVVMNIAGLEVATHQELDWDREFTSGGMATLVAGLGGGTVATLVVPASLRSKLFGAATRLTGLVAALVVATALFLGSGWLQLVPTPLVGGILVFAGLGMLEEGLIRTSHRLPRSEFGIVALIFISIIGFGLLEGVGAGMLATLVFFAVRLSRDYPVSARFTLRDRQSKRVRALPDRAILRERGGHTHAYLLRGYIFFGSIGPLADQLRGMLREPTPPDCLALDFARVSGCDYSAVHVFARTLEAAGVAGVDVVLSAVPEPLRRAFERDLPTSVYAKLLIEPDADRALECCEDLILEAWRTTEGREELPRAALLASAAQGLESHLERQIRFEELVDQLGAWMHTLDCAVGEEVARADALGGELKLMIFGRASAYAADGARLRQYVAGDAIWPAGVGEDSFARVVAEEPCRILTVSPEDRIHLEARHQAVAVGLYAYIFDGLVQRAGDYGPTQS